VKVHPARIVSQAAAQECFQALVNSRRIRDQHAYPLLLRVLEAAPADTADDHDLAVGHTGEFIRRATVVVMVVIVVMIMGLTMRLPTVKRFGTHFARDFLPILNRHDHDEGRVTKVGTDGLLVVTDKCNFFRWHEISFGLSNVYPRLDAGDSPIVASIFFGRL
jgi:hypothetical protein